jgi:hypothetical protein
VFSHAIYGRYSDNLTQEATTIEVQGGTIESGYTADMVADLDATQPCRLSTTSGYFAFGFDDPVGVKIMALIHSNFVEGAVIHVQANDTNDFSNPAFEATIPMPEWLAGRFPPNPWLRLDEASGWDTYAWWRVGGANTVNISVGEIVLSGAVREHQIQWSDKPAWDRPQVEHKTAYKRLRTPLGTTIRALNGVIPADDLDRQAIVDWVLDADGRPVLFIPESAAAPPEAWLARHTTTKQEVQEEFDEAHFLPLAIEEDGRGLEPTPSPLG